MSGYWSKLVRTGIASVTNVEASGGMCRHMFAAVEIEALYQKCKEYHIKSLMNIALKD